MKLLPIILLLLSFNVNATNYYFANAGSNGNSGTQISPFQTLIKLAAITLVGGDSVLLKAGDTFTGGFSVNQSGSSGLPIVFSSYSTGAKPNITGLTALIGWVNVSGNIWEATATNSVPYQKAIVINGIITAKGRYPNTTNITLNEAGNTTARIVTPLTGTPNYAGGEAVVNVYGFIHDVVKIVSQSVDTLKFYDDFNDFPPNTRLTYGESSRWFFLQNLPDFLDIQNEWCYDSLTKKVSMYSVGSPTSVQYSSIDTLVIIMKKDWITFNGLTFIGGNYHAIRTDTSDHISIINCVINNNGGDGIISKESDYLIIQNDSVTNNLNDGIFTVRNCNYTTITGNYIKNSGKLDGMGWNANGAYMGVFTQGLSQTVYNNRIDSTGYNGLMCWGTNSLVKYNYITDFCLQKEDGGGLCTSGDSYSMTGSRFTSNIMINHVGDLAKNWLVNGIYFDGNTNDMTADSNTVSNAPFGIFYHYPHGTNLRNNTFIGGTPIFFAQGGAPHDNLLRYNIFYSQDTLRLAIYNSYNTLWSGSTSDSNYIMRPLKPSNLIYDGEHGDYYNIASWYTATGYEQHSQSAPSGITSSAGMLLYNTTLSDSTFTLSGRYINAKGTVYTNSVVIHPFQSEVLFYATSQPTIVYSIGNLIFQ